MAFSTKKYTRPVLLAELRRVNVNNFTSLRQLATIISPRAGTRSAKISTLRQLTNGKLNKLFGPSAKVAKSNILFLVENS